MVLFMMTLCGSMTPLLFIIDDIYSIEVCDLQSSIGIVLMTIIDGVTIDNDSLAAKLTWRLWHLILCNGYDCSLIIGPDERGAIIMTCTNVYSLM